MSANELTPSSEFLQLVLDNMNDPIFVKDRQHRWIALNDAFCTLLGRDRADLIGRGDPDIFPPDQVEVFWALDDQLFRSGETNENEESLTDDRGVVHTLWTRKYPVRDQTGAIVGLVGIISDITSLRRRIDEIHALEQTAAKRQAHIDAQQQVIDSMEVPVIAVWEGILLVPLVGELSPRRANLVLERLLSAIASAAARVVFLDVSGIPSVDESSASTLLSAVAAARLLGVKTEIVGVGPEIAQTLVQLGIDLGGVETHATLRDGLRAALVRFGVMAR
ncbi:PAS domain-containing protein [Enhygromyxa salina]|uniref:RsbT co-antagonist protein RsbRD n=1 Tax=Enhygromyxa salina TaxID=215803 RepID=A0A2S9YTI9_9BACT|nr:PAS domain-containing protein [Enhygromyxa salina]PRQ08403.1 RsbT co-antagonist protein RsbRD [Enhygromyxa salina]